jgi:hypothetical protein
MRLLLLVAIAAIVAGCGSGGSPGYVDQVTKAEAVLQEALTDLGSESGELDASSRAIAGAARELDAAKPPGDEKHFHAHIVDGFRKVAATLHQAAEAGRDGDFAKRDDLLEHIDSSPGLKELELAERELDKADG